MLHLWSFILSDTILVVEGYSDICDRIRPYYLNYFFSYDILKSFELNLSAVENGYFS
jgi:hypothetical protein